jgi:Ca2+-binding RTX toxin-like protein
MKKAWLIVPAVAAVAALSVAGPAGAAVTCSYDTGTHNVTVKATGNNINVVIVRNGTAIQVNGAACGAADVNNTAQIKVTGGAGRQNVYIDFSGGAFAPGFGADAGVAEIEFAVDLKIGTDKLELDGSSNPDNYRIGTDGINFNGDSDLDITMPNVEFLYVFGNAGSDTLRADGGLGTGGVYPNKVYLFGGDGGDTLTAGSGTYNDLEGGNNNDVLNGGENPDNLYGNAGADTLNGGLEGDYLYPGPDNDTVNGGDGPDQIYCTDAFPDGNDVFNGGGGSDYVTYYTRTANLHLTIDGLANDGQSGETDNIKLDVERIQGGQGADTITGSDANNTLDGYLGADTIHGGLGDDNVYGGCCDTGADVLYGDDGNDSIYGYDGPDKLYGGTGRDGLTGGLGNDLMDAGSGNDSLYAEYNGLDGSDNLFGGTGKDQAYYYRATGDQTFTMGDSTANDGLAGEKDNIHSDIEDLTSGEGNDHLNGNALANTIYGYGGNDVIDGKDGADYLQGDDGNDTITGGDGEDTLYGYNGADSFKVQDGGYDIVYGGTDASTDVVVNKDSFDNIQEVP